MRVEHVDQDVQDIGRRNGARAIARSVLRLQQILPANIISAPAACTFTDFTDLTIKVQLDPVKPGICSVHTHGAMMPTRSGMPAAPLHKFAAPQLVEQVDRNFIKAVQTASPHHFGHIWGKAHKILDVSINCTKCPETSGAYTQMSAKPRKMLPNAWSFFCTSSSM